MHTSDFIESIIDLALAEDGDDITSRAIFSPETRFVRCFKAKAPG